MKILIPTLLAVAMTQASVLAKDVDIPLTELPKGVSESVMKAHPSAKILSAQKDLKADGAIQHFEVTLRMGDQKEKELTVLPDGTIQDDVKE